MSTVIDNAVRFSPGISLSDAIKWCMSLRTEIQQIMYQKDAQELLSAAVRVYDQKMLEKLSWASDVRVNDSKSAFLAAYRILDEEHREEAKAYGKRVPSIVVLPHGRSVYAIVYAPKAEELIEKYIQAGVWRDFSYWNNTDRPDELTSSQWARRKKVWDEIFTDSSIPSEVGVNINLAKEEQQLFNHRAFFAKLRSAIENKTPFEHEGEWPSVSRRAISMSHMIENAPWFSEYWENGQKMHVFSRITREIEQGKNEVFNQAQPFLEQHLIDQLQWENLWVSFENLQEHFDAKRAIVFAQDIPLALQTPQFQKVKLNYVLPEISTIKKAKI